MCPFQPDQRNTTPETTPTCAHRFSRRSLLAAGCVTGAGALTLGWSQRWRFRKADVFCAKEQRYDGPLDRTIRDGLLATGIDTNWLRGKRVLLKPNMVEPTRVAPHIATHPAVVLATAEIFRRWGADVVVGEGPGHVRDTEMALCESGIGEALRSADLPFADLNYEETVWVKNRSRVSPLPGLHLPRSVVEADLIVSMPKMKSHHIVGATVSMKNLYGVIPGIRYGWPKNVLHHAGIPETVCDINAALPKVVSVVDGIQCMEGDGPILGTPKHMGLILVGCVPAAVDATAARIMGLDPMRMRYLQLAAKHFGVIDDARIRQQGEPWQPLTQPFELLDKPHLQCLRV